MSRNMALYYTLIYNKCMLNNEKVITFLKNFPY